MHIQMGRLQEYKKFTWCKSRSIINPRKRANTIDVFEDHGCRKCNATKYSTNTCITLQERIYSQSQYFSTIWRIKNTTLKTSLENQSINTQTNIHVYKEPLVTSPSVEQEDGIEYQNLHPSYCLLNMNVEDITNITIFWYNFLHVTNISFFVIISKEEILQP